eukprot:NODE_640_length_1986_cov_55.899408_g592_i0.p1 GENE.NODE_640_length_1986_cov_55.899408_g592_i0~~NODE_640_length_1986_cov_55.899408_g592_i0.p1  ORF type:complete len:645 (+),score=137.66 NODE_640_length_1986_cov_55.899408_g592_i0:1-1935(+)
MEDSFVIENTKKTFKSFGLDSRLLEALEELEFEHPTLVQAACIPLGLTGKDVLAKADTGTGKTAAYALPMIQKVILQKKKKPAPRIRCLVLVPTSDLCFQTHNMIANLLHFLKDDIFLSYLLTSQSVAARIPILQSKPDILVSTPKALLQHTASRTIDLSQLGTFVIDEADIMLTDCKELGSLRSYIPMTCQTYMMSATLTDSVLDLKSKLLNHPVVVKTQSPQQASQITQKYVVCNENDRWLLLIGCLIKRIIEGKILIFCNEVDRAFRTQKLLECFKIDSTVLNSEIPQNCRNDVVMRFNEGRIGILIATDESMDLDDIYRRKEGLAVNTEDANLESKSSKKRKRPSDEAGPVAKYQKRQPIRQRNLKKLWAANPEYSAHRGIDYQNVNWVINFDSCKKHSQYMHRIGRTGRAAKSGTALSFFTPVQTEIVKKLVRLQEKEGNILEPFEHPVSDFEKLRLRFEDASERTGRRAVLKARTTEIARAVVESKKMKLHFKANPGDLATITRMAKGSAPQYTRTRTYLLPDYLGFNISEGNYFDKQNPQYAWPKHVQKQGKPRAKKEYSVPKLKAKPGCKAKQQVNRVNKCLTNAELQVIDPGALRRRDTDCRKQRRKMKRFKTNMKTRKAAKERRASKHKKDRYE